jgi:predicted phage terminase large subunit-like protein
VRLGGDVDGALQGCSRTCGGARFLDLIQSLREQSINITTYKPETDKRTRLISQIDLFAGGSIRLPQRAACREEFIAELLAFPGGHDDQVDALSQGLDWRRRNWGAITRPLRGLC